MEQLIFLISNLGFPIFTALFFMLEMKKAIKENTRALVALELIVRNCHKN